MTPRYARLAGWLLLAGVVGTVVACATPTVDGTDIDSASESATAGKRNKRTSSSSKTSGDDDDDSAPAKTPKPTTSTTAVPSTTTTTTPTSTGTTVAPPPTTTATTPPPVTQPNCQSGDPLACLDCCLNANPGATQFEDDYDFCMQGCPQGDIACLDDCQRQHVSTCSGNTSCTANHACMEANNCLAQNFCNPI